MDQSPGYRATASSGGMTSPGTTAAGMPGYAPPPPGLPPIDFSNWRLMPPEAPASRGLPPAPLSLPGVRRSIRLRGMAGAQTAQHPGGLAQWTQTQPTSVPSTPTNGTASPSNHYQGSWQCHTSRWYNCKRSPPGGEPLLNPPQIKPFPWAVQVPRTAEDLTLEGGEAVADLSAAQGACRRR